MRPTPIRIMLRLLLPLTLAGSLSAQQGATKGKGFRV